MDDVVGAEFFEDFVIKNMLLHDHFVDEILCAQHLHALGKRARGESVVAQHLGIGEHADDDAAEFCRLAQDVPVSVVDDVCAKACIYGFHWQFMSLSKSLSSSAVSISHTSARVHGRT